MVRRVTDALLACYNVLQCVTACYRMLQHVTGVFTTGALQRVVCRVTGVLQRITVRSACNTSM